MDTFRTDDSSQQTVLRGDLPLVEQPLAEALMQTDHGMG